MKLVGLSDKEKLILGEFYETDFYKVFRKVLDARRLVHAQTAIDVDPKNVVQLARVQGQAAEDKYIHQFIKSVNKEMREKEGFED